MSIFYRMGRRLCLPLLLSLAFVLLWQGSLFAQDGTDSGAADTGETKPCSSCHEEEADAWQQSLHAIGTDPVTGATAATCNSCHGDYVRGHPDEAVVPLRVDSSMCKECHASTWTEWENSIHGEEDVQCISCHLSHSQEMRLTDERLCTSCHQESLDDPMHSAHWNSDATCTSCHMGSSPANAAMASAGEGMALAGGANHDFVSVSAENCLECHREDVKSTAAAGDSDLLNVAYTGADVRVPELSAELESAEQMNRSLGILSVANLGFGLGIGGILGIAFMLVYARFGNRG